MINVTPYGQHYTYSHQDFDEKNALLQDLTQHRSAYLNHPDSIVRSLADWTMELYGLRTLRPGYAQRHKEYAPTE